MPPCSGGKKHVPSVSDALPGFSSGCSRNSSPSSTHQVQRSRAHRCRRTHVHQQPGHPHQVPRLQVRNTLVLAAPCLLLLPVHLWGISQCEVHLLYIHRLWIIQFLIYTGTSLGFCRKKRPVQFIYYLESLFIFSLNILCALPIRLKHLLVCCPRLFPAVAGNLFLSSLGGKFGFFFLKEREWFYCCGTDGCWCWPARVLSSLVAVCLSSQLLWPDPLWH